MEVHVSAYMPEISSSFQEISVIYFCGRSTQNYALGRIGLWEETRATEGNPHKHEEDLLTPFRRASVAVRHLCKTTMQTSRAAPVRRN